MPCVFYAFEKGELELLHGGLMLLERGAVGQRVLLLVTSDRRWVARGPSGSSDVGPRKDGHHMYASKERFLDSKKRRVSGSVNVRICQELWEVNTDVFARLSAKVQVLEDLFSSARDQSDSRLATRVVATARLSELETPNAMARLWRVSLSWDYRLLTRYSQHSPCFSPWTDHLAISID